MEKKLYRSTKDKKLAGVCGGLAEYINLDPTIVRLLWVLFCLVGAGIIAYIVAALIIPERPAEGSASNTEAKTESNPYTNDSSSEGTNSNGENN